MAARKHQQAGHTQQPSWTVVAATGRNIGDGASVEHLPERSSTARFGGWTAACINAHNLLPKYNGTAWSIFPVAALVCLHCYCAM